MKRTHRAPCPWCGYMTGPSEQGFLQESAFSLDEASGWAVRCAGCEATGPIVLMDTTDEFDEASVARAKAKALRLWNLGPGARLPRHRSA